MEEVKSWTFSVCCASIAGGMLNFLLPKGQTQTTYKTVFCIFFLCVIISPISDIKFPDFNILKSNYYTENHFENIFSKDSAECLENEITALVKEILKNENVICNDILVKVNISDNGSIDITKFVLTFEKLENTDLLAEKIGETLGITPKIVILGENKNE